MREVEARFGDWLRSEASTATGYRGVRRRHSEPMATTSNEESRSQWRTQ